MIRVAIILASFIAVLSIRVGDDDAIIHKDAAKADVTQEEVAKGRQACSNQLKKMSYLARSYAEKSSSFKNAMDQISPQGVAGTLKVAAGQLKIYFGEFWRLWQSKVTVGVRVGTEVSMKSVEQLDDEDGDFFLPIASAKEYETIVQASFGQPPFKEAMLSFQRLAWPLNSSEFAEILGKKDYKLNKLPVNIGKDFTFVQGFYSNDLAIEDAGSLASSQICEGFLEVVESLIKECVPCGCKKAKWQYECSLDPLTVQESVYDRCMESKCDSPAMCYVENDDPTEKSNGEEEESHHHHHHHHHHHQRYYPYI